MSLWEWEKNQKKIMLSKASFIGACLAGLTEMHRQSEVGVGDREIINRTVEHQWLDSFARTSSDYKEKHFWAKSRPLYYPFSSRTRLPQRWAHKGSRWHTRRVTSPFLFHCVLLLSVLSLSSSCLQATWPSAFSQEPFSSMEPTTQRSLCCP